MDETAIKVENVSKLFKLPREKNTTIKSAVVNFWRRDRGFEMQKALNNISFEIKRGEFFGIVGRNGSGKSTLLKLLAGIYAPTEGSVTVNGTLTPFIELGVGFNPELTGRENVYLNGALLGFSRKEMRAMYKDIVRFSELSKFMDQKLKNYSSGMQVRLAFSIAIRARSDILLIDEVLAVGDAAFQKKCFDHFMNLKKNKQTVILVTHDMGAVRQYCDRAMMIDEGDIVFAGKPEEAAQAYQKMFAHEMEIENLKVSQNKSSNEDHWGSGKMLCLRPKVVISGSGVELSCQYKANVDLPPPVFGFTVFNSTGVNILEGNTLKQKIPTNDVKKGERVKIVWQIPNVFSTGVYHVSVACCDQSTTDYYDWFNEAAVFNILKDSSTAGLIDPEIKLKNLTMKENG